MTLCKLVYKIKIHSSTSSPQCRRRKYKHLSWDSQLSRCKSPSNSARYHIIEPWSRSHP